MSDTAGAARPIRVLLVDDQEMIRDGLAVVLQAGGRIEVVAQAGDGREAVEAAARMHPDVVVMDIRMPVMDGLAATREILRAEGPGGPTPAESGGRAPGGPGGRATSAPGPGSPSGGPAEREGGDAVGPRVLILTTFDLDEYVYEALAAGASGFMLKDAPARDLVAAVEVVAAGDGLLAPSVTRRLIADVAARRRRTPSRPEAVAELTPRELDVLRLIARGMSNAEIAERLVLAEQTVKTHVGHILLKLGLRDRAQAVVLAYESGLVGA